MELGAQQYSNGVNDYLAEGWMLLLVYADSTDSDHGPAQKPICVLGWPRDEDPPSAIAEAEAHEEGLRLLEEIRGMNR